MFITSYSKPTPGVKDEQEIEITATPAELSRVSGITGMPVEAGIVSFTEDGAGTYTGSVEVPAGALILDIKAWNAALWTAATSAAMDIGDAADPNGWFAAINMKATDLVVGEEINFIQTGGKEGAYLNTTTGARSAAYSATARTITGVIVSVGAGTAGRSFMAVIWTKPTATVAVKT